MGGVCAGNFFGGGAKFFFVQSRNAHQVKEKINLN